MRSFYESTWMPFFVILKDSSLSISSLYVFYAINLLHVIYYLQVAFRAKVAEKYKLPLWSLLEKEYGAVS